MWLMSSLRDPHGQTSAHNFSSSDRLANWASEHDHVSNTSALAWNCCPQTFTFQGFYNPRETLWNIICLWGILTLRQLSGKSFAMSLVWVCIKLLLQVTAFYAPQFAELRARCCDGGEEAFICSLSRCRWVASCQPGVAICENSSL